MKMDRIDYTFKFSTELVVFVLSLIIVGVNAAGASNIAYFHNNNLLAKFLSYHPEQNKNLYTKSTAVRTVVSQNGNSIIAQASAARAVFASSAAPTPSVSLASTSIIQNNSISRPNPDSVRDMIVDQIQVYQTQPGDTLAGVARQFNISTNTIKWVNNLSSDTIKPGWFLQILPVDGILHKVTNNDTLPDIARKFKANIENIVSYNNLEDENDIEPGDIIIIPGGSITSPATPKPSVQINAKGRIFFEPAPGEITEIEGPKHIFPKYQCTWYIAQRRNIPWGGNAKNWLVNAQAYGAKLGTVPIVGAIVVTTENKKYGHLALVEKVEGDRFYVSEYNYKPKQYTERWINMSSPVIRGFIY